MKEVKLATIETLEKDIFSTYEVSMQEVTSSIYEGLLNNSLFVTQMKQSLNSKSSLYDVYKDNVEGNSSLKSSGSVKQEVNKA